LATYVRLACELFVASGVARSGGASETTESQAVPKQVPNRAILAVLQRPQPITVFEMHPPTGDVIHDRTNW
jgi:hypothetical protein